MQALEDLLPLFKRHQKTNSGFLVTCPIHDDSSPSLHLSKGIDSSGKERLLVKCFANCDSTDVLNWINANSKHNGARNNVVAQSVNTKKTGNFSTLVKTYNYRNTEGKIVYQVLRYANPKSFRFRRPVDDPNVPNGYVWSIGDTDRILYNYNLVYSSIQTGQYVWKVEGEKDADALTELGFTATCNLFGAGSGKWRPEYCEQLRGANLLCVPDEDEAGYVHIYEVISELIKANACKSIRLIILPVNYKGDIYDYLTSGHSKEDLYNLIDNSFNVTNENDEQLRKLLFIDNSANGALVCSKFTDKSEYDDINSSFVETELPAKKSSKFEQTELFRQAKDILEKDGPYAGLCMDCLGTGFTIRTTGDMFGVVVESGDLVSDDDHQSIKLERCLHGVNSNTGNFPF